MPRRAAGSTPGEAEGKAEKKTRGCRIAVYGVRLERERYLAFPWRQFDDAADAVALFRHYVGVPDREHLIAVHLDARDRVSGVHTVSVGSLQQGEAGAREVFKAAILASAASIVLVHNHPSGDPSPSPDDVSVAQGLEFVGQLLRIPVVDHVIVGDPGYASLRGMGLLEFDPRDPDPIGTRNVDEGWAAGLEMLRFGSSFLAGGMAAVQRQARRERRRSKNSRGFLAAPGRRATLNPIVVIEPDTTLRPGELEPLLEELQRRIGAALERALDGVPAKVRIEDVGVSSAKAIPVFPIVVGTRVFEDSSEVAETVEEQSNHTGMSTVAYDAAGRAFSISLWTRFGRLERADRRVEDVFTFDDAEVRL